MTYDTFMISNPCLLRRSGNNDTPLAISSHNTQVLVSKYHSSKREPGLLRNMVDSRSGKGKTHNGPGTSVVPENKEVPKKKKSISRTWELT